MDILEDLLDCDFNLVAFSVQTSGTLQHDLEDLFRGRQFHLEGILNPLLA